MSPVATPPEPNAPWVLLRGLTRESDHWGDFPLRLQRAGAGAPVVCIDLPGNGRHSHLPSPTRIPALTEAARAQLLGQGLEPPYRLMAMSLGGMVAADWATRHPGELLHALLINTSLRPFSPWYHRLRPGRWPALLSLLWPGQSERRREATVFKLTSRLPAPPEGLIDHWVALRQAHPVTASNAARQLLAALRYRAPHGAPAVPIQLLASTRDGLVNVRCSRELAAQWQLPLSEHPWAGHDLPLDDPAWVLDQALRLSHPRRCGAQRPAPCPTPCPQPP